MLSNVWRLEKDTCIRGFLIITNYESIPNFHCRKMMIGYKRKILSGIWETIWWITHVFIVYNRMNDFAGTVHESMEKFFESNIRNSSAMYVFLWNRRECRFKKKSLIAMCMWTSFCAIIVSLTIKNTGIIMFYI